MRRYETTFIIDGVLNEEDREALINSFENSLKKLGGDIERTVLWGMRQLAYEIKKRTHGFYVIFYYTAEPSTLTTFHRDLSINENILRHMSLLFDGKHPVYIRDEGVSAPTSLSPVGSNSVTEKVEESIEESASPEGKAVDFETAEVYEKVDKEDVEDKTPDSDVEVPDDNDEKDSADNEMIQDKEKE